MLSIYYKNKNISRLHLQRVFFSFFRMEPSWDRMKLRVFNYSASTITIEWGKLYQLHQVNVSLWNKTLDFHYQAPFLLFPIATLITLLIYSTMGIDNHISMHGRLLKKLPRIHEWGINMEPSHHSNPSKWAIDSSCSDTQLQ